MASNLTLADFGLVFCAIGTTAGAGNPVTTPSQIFSVFPNGTGAGDQLVSCDPIDSLESIVAVCTQTVAHVARVTHTSDISKRIRINSVATNAAANGRVTVAILCPPAGTISVP